MDDRPFRDTIAAKWCAAALVASLASCGGGGGDDGSMPAGQIVLLDAVVSGQVSTPSPLSSWQAAVASPRYRVPEPGRVEVCAHVSWRQQMRQAAALTMRSVLEGAGPEIEDVVTAAGAPGLNTLAWSYCGQYDAAAPEERMARLRLDLQSTGGSGAGPLQGYSVTVRWMVVAR
jgi:hypothetical protein